MVIMSGATAICGCSIEGTQHDFRLLHAPPESLHVPPMGCIVSDQERAAISAYTGPVKHCPDGSAAYAHWVSKMSGGWCEYLRAQGLDIPDDARGGSVPNLLGMDSPVRAGIGHAAHNEARDANIWRDYERGIGRHSLARKYDMTPSAVSQVLWKMRKKEAA